MRAPTIAVLVTAAAVFAACSARQAAVPLVGTAGDVEALVGQWAGEYSSSETGRSGSISFTLTAQGDTARGDVIMIPTGFNQPMRPARDEARMGPDRGYPEVLTIRFVRVRGGEVSGSLEPYREPTCGCVLRTSFTGRLAAGAIDGTYTSHVAATGQEQRGRWKVTRAR